MRTSMILLICVGVAGMMPAAAGEDLAGQMLTVRLLEADNSGRTDAQRELSDVLPMLRKTLAFSSYRLLEKQGLRVWAGANAALGRGLKVSLAGLDGRTLTVEVFRLDRRLVQTRLVLVPDKPVILGGFPDEQGKSTLIIVLSLP